MLGKVMQLACDVLEPVDLVGILMNFCVEMNSEGRLTECMNEFKP